MQQLFISDLHLKPERPDISRALINFLQTEAPKCDQLFLLGDIFEAWIGDDAPYPGCEAIVLALKSLSSSGVELFFQHGNRDFLVGQAFADSIGAVLLPEEHLTVSADHRPLLLLHGDQLCTDDNAYMSFRELVRNPAWQQQFLAKTIEERLQIANQIRQQSKQSNAEKTEQIMDVAPATVADKFNRHNCNLMLHGHTHRPAIHENQEGTRIVLGDWDEKGWYIRWDEDGFSLIDFPLKGFF